MKANEVMRIGRKRNRAASAAASMRPLPDSISCLANSTIKIAFLQAIPDENDKSDLGKNIVVLSSEIDSGHGRQ
jgi:hypothetical protein